MSEELLQITAKPLGRYLYYRIGSTTLGQLKKQKVIKDKFSNSLSAKKPDGLIVLSGGDVKAVIEYKQSSELRTKKLIEKAILQELEVAKELCKILIVTDGKKTFWINALNGERILNEDAKELKIIFDAKPIENASLSNEEMQNIEQLIDKIDHSLSKENNKISTPEVLDPSALARTIWQKIWINTGKEPEKCLYNVVELFVFKFLSDVGVLRSHNNFNSVYNLLQIEDANEALKHYSNTCRREIRELFPKGEDGTTVINGTIFVNEKGEPNLTQSSLFKEVLEDLQNYDSEFGSFKYIQKEFKTRLYESFLRQNAGVKSLGQYFTPRNVVKAMVEMSDASKLKKGARVCDPFCGVGGFLLELISANKHIMKEFEPKNEEVAPKIKIIGYDKGSDEKEDERTIILAKANMLIYFSDLLVKYHSKKYLKAFSEGAFNKVFHLLRSNLGTFGKVNDEPYDLILTNPPYVTSGSRSLKRSIHNNGLSEYYSLSGRGTEALSIEWIIKNLKEDGQSLVIIPDGLMKQESVLEYIKLNCVIQGIISLPNKTFYSTPKKTYILILKKKLEEYIQEEPIFTYLISEIGETRDSKRWATPEKNDLIEMVELFNQFKGSPIYFKNSSERLKIIDFEDFNIKTDWLIERWWTKEEKISLGIEKKENVINTNQFPTFVGSITDNIIKLKEELHNIVHINEKELKFKYIPLLDSEVFLLRRGKRITTTQINSNIGNIPVYSSSKNEKSVLGMISLDFLEKNKLIIENEPSITFNLDGSVGYCFVRKDKIYSFIDVVANLKPIRKDISLEYIKMELESNLKKLDADYTTKLYFNKLEEHNIRFKIPILNNGEFDIDTQEKISEKYKRTLEIKELIEFELNKLKEISIEY